MNSTVTEDLTAQVDGTTVVFTTPFVFVPRSLEVYRNGVRQTSDFFVELSQTSFETCEPLDVDEQLAVQAETPTIGVGVVVASGIDPARC